LRQGGGDLVQIVPGLVNSDAAITASGRERGRIVLAFGDPDPAFLESWRDAAANALPGVGQLEARAAL
jgi:hypothetical protein